MSAVTDIRHSSSMAPGTGETESVNKHERYADPTFNSNSRMSLELEC